MRVVIAPATSVTDQVHECLRSWSSGGLLERFCIWRVPLEAQSEDLHPVVLVDSGVERPGTLPEALQETPSDQVTLLGFYASAKGEAFDPRFSALVGDCLRHATQVLAYDRARPVECTMIVAPGETGQPVPPEVLCGTRNLYVAPEDRAAPPAPNQLADSNASLPRHAAHALATIGGLWIDPTGRSSGVVEAVAAEDVNAIEPPAVRVVRCFSRVVDLGYVADHIAAGVFRAGDEWPNPDPDHFDRVSDPTRLVKHAVRELVEIHSEVIGLTRFEPLKLPPEKRPTLLEAVRELIDRLRARIRRLPTELRDATVGPMYNFVVDQVDRMLGPDGPRTLRWNEKPESDRDIAEIADQLERPFSMPEGSASAVWHDLRQLVLALVDGSGLPGGMEASAYVRAGKRALVTRPSALAPDPSQLPPAEGANRACDPLGLDRRFAAQPEEGEPDATEDREELDMWLEGRRQSLLWGVGHAIATALTEARAAAAEIDALAEAAKEAEEVEESEGTDTAKEATSSGPAAAGESRWRRLRNSLLLNTALALVASTVGWAQLDFVQAAGVQAIVAIAWVLGFFYLAWRFVIRERSILRAEAEQQLATVNERLRRALHAGDEPRLERRYGEYLDWAEIIGWMVHEPWVGEPVEHVEVRGAIAQRTLPAAFRVGVARIPESTLERLCGQARAGVFQTSWLSAHYGLVADRAMERVALSYSYSGSGGSPNPDADDLDDPDSPRRQLLAAIRRGEGRRLHDNEMTNGVLRFVDRIPLDRAAEEVRSAPMTRADSNGWFDGHLLDPLPPCAAWFAPPASLPDLAPRLLGMVIRVTVNSSTGPRVGLGVLLGPEGPAVTSLSVVASALTIGARLPDGSQCKASVLRALPDADLALLEVDGPAQPIDDCPLSDDSGGSLGDPIVAPSPPNAEDGRPAMALGLITAEYGRGEGSSGAGISLAGATYRTTAGPAGSPVFDLNGRLVGIHSGSVLTAGDDDLAAARTLVRSSAVQALIDAAEAPEGEAQAAAAGAGAGASAGESEANGAADLATAAPSKFIGALFPSVDGPAGLLPQHWLDPDDQHLIESVLEKPDLDGGDLGSLSVGARFMQPLRVLVHRVDMTQAVAARELASCAIPAADTAGRPD